MLILLSAIPVSLIFSQEQTDIELLKQADEKSYFKHDPHDRIPAKNENKNFSPGVLALNIYKEVIADQLSRSCIYKITCSDFMRLSIRRYGLIKGVAIGLDRLSRCNEMGTKNVPPYKYDPDTNLIIDNPKEYEF